MSDNPSEDFAQVARDLRWEAGLSQAELAERANVNSKTVRELESGKKPGPPWPPTYRRLRDFYKTELGDAAAKSFQAAWIAWKLWERADRIRGASAPSAMRASRETQAIEEPRERAEAQEPPSRSEPEIAQPVHGHVTARQVQSPGDAAGHIGPAGPAAIPVAAPAHEESASTSAESPTPSAPGAPGDGRSRRTRTWFPLGIATLILVMLSVTLFATSHGILSLGSQRTPTGAGSVPTHMRIEGNLAAAVQLSANRTGLGFIDPATGAVLSLPLVPEEQARMQSYISPAYAPSQQLLAFIALAVDGTRSIWIAQVRATGDNGLHIVQPGPRKLVANCGKQCKTLTFTPSGDWLIVEGPDGLTAFNTHTGEQHAVTHGAHDAWPACSPDGRWLTYQYGVETAGYIVAAPAQDCFPVSGTTENDRVLSGYILAWHPTWSFDGTHVAFIVKASKGTRVYVVDVSALARGDNGSDAQLSPQPISESGCGDPVWATTTQAPHNVLLYTCPSPSGRQLVVASGSDLSHRQIVGGKPNVAEPTFSNPTWIAPEAA